MEAHDDFAIPDERALIHFPLAAEQHHLRLHLPNQRCKCRIVRVEHGDVLCRHVLELPHLHRRVDFHRAVAIEMVFGNIEQRRRLRVERLRRLHLEGRDFADEQVVVLTVETCRAVRIADVAHDMRRASCIAEDFAQQRDGRRLAVRAGNRHHFT